MAIDSRKRVEPSTLEVTLVIDMTPNIVKDPLNHTRVRKQGESILERQSVSSKQHCFDPSPIPVLKLRNRRPIVHVPSIEGPIPQVIIAILQNSLRKNRGEGNSGDHGDGGRRHDNKRGVAEIEWWR